MLSRDSDPVPPIDAEATPDGSKTKTTISAYLGCVWLTFS